MGKSGIPLSGKDCTRNLKVAKGLHGRTAVPRLLLPERTNNMVVRVIVSRLLKTVRSTAAKRCRPMVQTSGVEDESVEIGGIGTDATVMARLASVTTTIPPYTTSKTNPARYIFVDSRGGVVPAQATEQTPSIRNKYMKT